jgi:hypothetical protein
LLRRRRYTNVYKLRQAGNPPSQIPSHPYGSFLWSPGKRKASRLSTTTTVRHRFCCLQRPPSGGHEAHPAFSPSHSSNKYLVCRLTADHHCTRIQSFDRKRPCRMLCRDVHMEGTSVFWVVDRRRYLLSGGLRGPRGVGTGAIVASQDTDTPARSTSSCKPAFPCRRASKEPLWRARFTNPPGPSGERQHRLAVGVEPFFI